MNPAPQGPIVADSEDLYRGITTPAWWVTEEQRPSSAAFKQPDFSVDIVSLAGSVAHTLAHLPAGSGVVQFGCGAAREIGYTTRQETDPEQPDNYAHANVYTPGNQNQRKKMAQKLAQLCDLVHPPAFVETDTTTDDQQSA